MFLKFPNEANIACRNLLNMNCRTDSHSPCSTSCILPCCNSLILHVICWQESCSVQSGQVHLHHEDFELVKQAILKDPSLLPGNARAQLVEDAAISQGGCLLETDFGEIDATFENSRDLLFAAVDKAVASALHEVSQSHESD